MQQELTTTGDTNLFDHFWNYYPRKCAKAAARKAFAKLKPDNNLVELMIHNMSQRIEAGEWSQDRKMYIPHPATFLNGERWEDEIISTPVKQRQVDIGDSILIGADLSWLDDDYQPRLQA